MRSILLPLLTGAVLIAVLGLLGTKLGGISQINPLAEEPKKEVTVGAASLKVSLADEERERRQGLSGKKSLAPDEGLLFVFESQDVYPSFWMKDMLIPIDIIWINDGKVSKIDKNIPPPGKDTPESELKLYYPDKPVDYVLEVPAGFSDANNLRVGESVSGI